MLESEEWQLLLATTPADGAARKQVWDYGVMTMAMMAVTAAARGGGGGR